MEEPATDAPPAGRAPVLSVEGFSGPLDFLVEMVRRHRVDLRQLSILALVDQFVAALEAHADDVPLEQRSAWVVLASQLVLLKAQLLAPAGPEEAERAEEEAQRRMAQLEELALMRAAAEWLGARPQLGRDFHARGQRERPTRPRSEMVLAFLEAVLVMLEGRVGREVTPVTPYRPAPPDLVRMPEALIRIREILTARPAGGPLRHFLPQIPPGHPQAALKRRSAVASTFLAGLQLAGEGVLRLEQEAPFGPIFLSALDATPRHA
ncbi:segregation and condensation protein A [Roseomonas marmotae]|uniref:Segregation and condensation protein A n=1 Tax=Roseomonas marmotae TaxID=2768161 RepID=A0ABS3KB42_9PROT|nr:ScpA family protein [Roseomonas marmotae]MBO1074659.1 segregation/condensation protein A [Roseomonas marmotae]QTI81678.1 segregation/condensation protein A [Roseomonas marmotae]